MAVRKCKVCKTVLNRKQMKFCSHACSAKSRIIERPCAVCGKPTRSSRKKYCSMVCYRKHEGKRNQLVCKNCGKKFEQPVGTTASKRKYCSINCSKDARRKRSANPTLPGLLEVLGKEPTSLEGLRKVLYVDDAKIYELIAHACASGYNLRRYESGEWYWDKSATAGKLMEEHVPILEANDSFKVALIADTEIGCALHKEPEMVNFIRRVYEDDGVRLILHGGDLVYGVKVYRGQEYETSHYGMDAQVKEAVREFPVLDGLKYAVIGGNHDYAFMREVGADPLRSLCDKRPDIRMLGWYEGFVNVNGVTFQLHHGDGGGAYAMSYKMQRFVDMIPGGQKPDVLVQGHYHDAIVLPWYRNVQCFHPGSFNGRTKFLKRKGLHPFVGGCVLEIFIHKEKNGKTHVRDIEFKYKGYYLGPQYIPDDPGSMLDPDECDLKPGEGELLWKCKVKSAKK